MRDGGGQFDVAHALAAHLGQRHFDAALFADQALVLHALVLAAQALVILDRPEDARAEQAVALRLERAVVDRLGLLDLAERPRQDVVGRRDRDLDLVERRQRGLRLEEVGDLVHRLISPRCTCPFDPFGPDGGAGFVHAGPRRFGLGLAGNGRAGRRSEAPPRNLLYSAACGGNCGLASAASSGPSPGPPLSEFRSSTLRPSARISFTSTLKLSGTPASKASSPRTMAS